MSFGTIASVKEIVSPVDSGEAVFQAQDAPANVRAGIVLDHGEMAGSFLQIGFHLLAVKIGVASLYNTIFHKKGGTSRDKRGCHRCTGILGITAAGGSAENIDTGGGDVRFWQGKPGKTLS